MTQQQGNIFLLKKVQSLSESKLRREMDGGDSWWMNGNLGAISSNLFL
jgi:hypothetical protein